MAPGRLYIKFFKDVQNSDIDIMLPGAEVGRDTSHSRLGNMLDLARLGKGKGVPSAGCPLVLVNGQESISQKRSACNPAPLPLWLTIFAQLEQLYPTRCSWQQQ